MEEEELELGFEHSAIGGEADDAPPPPPPPPPAADGEDVGFGGFGEFGAEEDNVRPDGAVEEIGVAALDPARPNPDDRPARIRVPLYIVIAANIIKHMLHIIALLALVSTLMLIGAAINPDIAQFPLNSTSKAYAIADADAIIDREHFSFGIFGVRDEAGGWHRYSDELCGWLDQHSDGPTICGVRHAAAFCMAIAIVANGLVLLSIGSLFSTKEWRCCIKAKHVGPGLFIGTLAAIISGIIATSVLLGTTRNLHVTSGAMVPGTSFVVLTVAWPISLLNLVLALCTAVLIFMLGQVYNHLVQRQLQDGATGATAAGHRLPLEPYVLRMICRSEGLWGSDVVDPISLDTFQFGPGSAVLPCGHTMTKTSADMLFNDAPETELKPCPMCRLMVSKKAFAVVTEKDAPPPVKTPPPPPRADIAEQDGGARTSSKSTDSDGDGGGDGGGNGGGGGGGSEPLAAAAGGVNEVGDGGSDGSETGEGGVVGARSRGRLRRASMCDPEGLGIEVDPALIGLGPDGQPLGIPVRPRPHPAAAAVPTPESPEPGNFAVADTLLQGLWL